MKTLLLLSILILVQIQGFGQEKAVKFPPDIAARINQEMKTLDSFIFENEVCIGEPYKKAYLKLIAEEWQQYKQECLKDSVGDHVYIYEVWDGERFRTQYLHSDYIQFIPMESNYLGDTILWRYKQPTAEEFLDKLYKH